MRVPLVIALGIALGIALVTIATVAAARPAAVPTTQALTCPDDADTCDLETAGTLVYSQRDVHAKWDNLRIASVVDGKRVLVYASVNIPNRTRLKLETNTRYRFKISARKPFGARDLWVMDATRQ
jgi:hypothetical protein